MAARATIADHLAARSGPPTVTPGRANAGIAGQL